MFETTPCIGIWVYFMINGFFVFQDNDNDDVNEIDMHVDPKRVATSILPPCTTKTPKREKG